MCTLKRDFPAFRRVLVPHIRVAGFDVVMGGPTPARPMTVKESERLELPPHLIAEPVAIQTEYAELAAANHLSIPQAALSCGQMLELRAAPTATLPAPTSWPCATTCALSHPGLLGMVRRLNGLGYRLVVDTSLRQPLSSPASRGTHAAQELLVRHLATVGAYFSQRRRCIGIAADSTWHELIHEGCHATFDARVRQAVKETPMAPEALQTHYEHLRARGYTEKGAEQYVCHTHELYALRDRPSTSAAIRRVLVWDNMNLDAYRDLSAIPPAERSAAHEAEIRRIAMLRRFVTGPAPRLGICVAVAIGVVTGFVGVVAKPRSST